MGDLNPEQQESWKRRSGQIYNPQTGTLLPTIEFEAPYRNSEADPSIRITDYDGMSGYEITPIDANQARIRITDAAAAGEFLEGQWIVTPGKTVVSQLPDVLIDVDVAFNKTIGNGEENYPVSQQYFLIQERGSGSISPRASAEGSASIVPSVSYDIDDHYRRKYVNSTIYTFFMPAETTMAEILTKLSAKAGVTVSDFPNFNPKSHQVRLFGQQKSVQAKASSEANLGFSSDDDGLTSLTEGYQWGNGFSRSNGVSERVEQIPSAIHGSITIASNTDSADVIAEVQANTTSLDINGTPEVGAITNEPAAVEDTAEASAVFENGSATVSATPGASSIPTSGLRVVNIQAGRDLEFDFQRVTVEVVDFTQYA